MREPNREKTSAQDEEDISSDEGKLCKEGIGGFVITPFHGEVSPRLREVQELATGHTAQSVRKEI